MEILNNIIEFVKSSDTLITVSIITGLFSLSALIIKILYDWRSINLKLRREYHFEQKKQIAKIISESKTPLLRAAEELNYRLWNYIKYHEQPWLNLPESEWNNEKHYYLRSFIFRFLLFYYWILRSEESLIKLDQSVANRSNKKYLKFIKSMKHIVCEKTLFIKLDYGPEETENHFYKDYLKKYTNYIETDNNIPIEFYEFEEKMKIDYSEIEKVILYINNIKFLEDNMNHIALKSLHLIIIKFLNLFGNDYQKTSSRKISILLKRYSYNKIKEELVKFLIRNKIYNNLIMFMFRIKSGYFYRVIKIIKNKDTNYWLK